MFSIRSKNLLIPFLKCILVIQFSLLSNSQCSPSSCGSIHNISFPFRLNTDPENCGNPDYQLTCEQNRTVLTLKSQKYYVQSINYNNYTVRVVDPGVQQNNICSFPRYSLAGYHFSYGYSYPYDIAYAKRKTYWEEDLPSITVPIIFFSCPFPVKSSAFVETTKDCWSKSSDSSEGYAYVKLGPLNAGDLRVSCGVEMITMTSWRSQEENVASHHKVSLFGIHDALMYGFELSWLPVICHQQCRSKMCYLPEATTEISCLIYSLHHSKNEN